MEDPLFKIEAARRLELRDEEHLKQLIAGGKTVVINRRNSEHLNDLVLGGGSILRLPSVEQAYRAASSRASQPFVMTPRTAATIYAPSAAAKPKRAFLRQPAGEPPDINWYGAVALMCRGDEDSSCPHFAGAEGKMKRRLFYLEAYNRGFDLSADERDLCARMQQDRAPDPEWLRACAAHIASNPNYLEAVLDHQSEDRRANMDEIAADSDFEAGDEARASVDDLKEAIDEAPPVSKEFVAFRGVGDSGEFRANLTDVYTMQGFGVASLSSVVALRHSGIGVTTGYLQVITIPARARALFIGSTEDSGDRSKLESDSEVTLNHGSKFRVDRVEQEGTWGYNRGVDGGCVKGTIPTVYLTLSSPP